MGSYVFTFDTNDQHGIEQEVGESWRASFRREGAESRGVAFASASPQSDLASLCTTLRILPPPEALMRRGSTTLGPSPIITAPTDVDHHQIHTFTFRPTDVVVEGYRAWLVEQNWLGGDVHSTKGFYADAFWLNEEKATSWAKAQQRHPLVQLLSKELSTPSLIFAPADTDIETWEGAWVHYQGHRLLTERDKFRKHIGVYLQLYVQFGRWSGTILVCRPTLWELKIELDVKAPLIPVYFTVVARNGLETRMFSYDGGPLDRDATYTTELPNLPEHKVQDASGKHATFWRSSAAWREYAKPQKIRANRPLSLLRPNRFMPEEEVLIPLTKEEAERAYESGVSRLPEVICNLNIGDFVEVSDAANGSIYKVVSTEHPCVGAVSHKKPGDDQFVVFLPPGFRGWIRPEESIQVSQGTTIREPGDKNRHVTEFCVYTNGEVVEPNS